MRNQEGGCNKLWFQRSNFRHEIFKQKKENQSKNERAAKRKVKHSRSAPKINIARYNNWSPRAVIYIIHRCNCYDVNQEKCFDVFKKHNHCHSLEKGLLVPFMGKSIQIGLLSLYYETKYSSRCFF